MAETLVHIQQTVLSWPSRTRVLGTLLRLNFMRYSNGKLVLAQTLPWVQDSGYSYSNPLEQILKFPSACYSILYCNRTPHVAVSHTSRLCEIDEIIERYGSLKFMFSF